MTVPGDPDGAFTTSTGTLLTRTHLIVRTGPQHTRSSPTEPKKKKRDKEAFTYDFDRAVERARSATRRNPDVLSLQNGLDYCKEEQSGGHGRTAHARGAVSSTAREGRAPRDAQRQRLPGARLRRARPGGAGAAALRHMFPIAWLAQH